jgi:arsenate reductase (glutaredoxin)
MSHFPETVLLHNPSCSKSRTALSLLTDRGVSFSAREYLLEPLSRDELGALQVLLDLHPREWVRAGGPEWSESGLTLSSEAGSILDAIASWPALLQRPILIHGERALVGRPPTVLLELLVD